MFKGLFLSIDGEYSTGLNVVSQRAKKICLKEETWLKHDPFLAARN